MKDTVSDQIDVEFCKYRCKDTKEWEKSILDLVRMADFEYAKVELPLLGEGLHVLKE